MRILINPDLLTFTLIIIPVAILIGLASSTIGFTGWTLIVPITLIGFRFNLWDALFVSIITGVGIYVILSWMFRVNEMRELLKVIVVKKG